MRVKTQDRVHDREASRQVFRVIEAIRPLFVHVGILCARNIVYRGSCWCVCSPVPFFLHLGLHAHAPDFL